MKNLLLGAVAVWAFCGCAGLKPSADKDVALIGVPEENWTRYEDTDGAFTVAGLDAGEREWSGDEKLRRLRRIKIYEFKEGAVKVTDYEAQGGVCEAFFAGKKISATSVESRDGEGARQILAVRTRGEISLEGVKIFSSQENSSPQKQLFSDEKGSRGAQAKTKMLIKQAQTLKNIVCAGFGGN